MKPIMDLKKYCLLTIHFDSDVKERPCHLNNNRSVAQFNFIQNDVIWMYSKDYDNINLLA